MTSFGLYLDNELITNMPVLASDQLGITISQIPIPGMVALYEEHDARISSGYTLNEWYNLTSRDRALEVAMQRVKGAIEYQKQKKMERDIKKASKRK